MVNIYMLEHERKAREMELERYVAVSKLRAEAHKLDSHRSVREGIATLLIAMAERIAPAAHEAHMHPVLRTTTAHC